MASGAGLQPHIDPVWALKAEKSLSMPATFAAMNPMSRYVPLPGFTQDVGATGPHGFGDGDRGVGVKVLAAVAEAIWCCVEDATDERALAEVRPGLAFLHGTLTSALSRKRERERERNP